MTSTSGKDIPGSSGEDKGVAELARGMLLGDRETAEQMRWDSGEGPGSKEKKGEERKGKERN
eukprot:1161979-Pelagomonas_calceolata.AAC.22